VEATETASTGVGLHCLPVAYVDVEISPSKYGLALSLLQLTVCECTVLCSTVRQPELFQVN